MSKAKLADMDLRLFSTCKVFDNLTARERVNYQEACDFYKFLRTGKRGPLKSGRHSLFASSQTVHAMTFHVDTDGALHFGDSHWLDVEFARDISKEGRMNACGVVALAPARHKSWKYICVFDADDSDNADFGSWLSDTTPYVYLSFQCVAELLKIESEKVDKLLYNGELIIRDYTSDERINLTASALATLKKYKKAPIPASEQPKPPYAGFTLIDANTPFWHRSGSIVLHHKKKDKYYLIGQDEGQYFGCELPEAATTISEAFSVLMPEAVQDRSGVLRQGEWFMLPVDRPPEESECALCYHTPDNAEAAFLSLPRDDIGGNVHSILSRNVLVGRDGVVYAYNPMLRHMDHSTVNVQNGWVSFHKNTAVRSVSVEGVD